MTSYETEEDYIKDQISSYKFAKRTVRRFKQEYLSKMLGDLRGDNEKVIEALNAAIKHLETQKKALFDGFYNLEKTIGSPRTFRYREMIYFGDCAKIDWQFNGLRVKYEPRGWVSEEVAEEIVQPTAEQWKNFEKNVKRLDLNPADNDDICDGYEVECHITFQKKLVRFYLINPDFRNFKILRKYINELTQCKTFPNGLLEELD